MQDAQQVVLAEKPTIQGTSLTLAPELRDALLLQLSTLASVYHKLPGTFVKRRRAAVDTLSDLEARRTETLADDGDLSGTLSGNGGTPGSRGGAAAGAAAPGSRGEAGAESEPTAMDLLGGDDVRLLSCVCAAVGRPE
jgi:AP-1 complex subunit beta-1